MSKRPVNRPVKRINCHLYADTIPVIDRFAEVMGVTRAAVIRDLLDQAAPDITAITERLATLKSASDPSLVARAEAIAKTLDANVKKGVSLL